MTKQQIKLKLMVTPNPINQIQNNHYTSKSKTLISPSSSNTTTIFIKWLISNIPTVPQTPPLTQPNPPLYTFSFHCLVFTPIQIPGCLVSILSIITQSWSNPLHQLTI